VQRDLDELNRLLSSKSDPVALRFVVRSSSQIDQRQSQLSFQSSEQRLIYQNHFRLCDFLLQHDRSFIRLAIDTRTSSTVLLKGGTSASLCAREVQVRFLFLITECVRREQSRLLTLYTVSCFRY
jgi:hypothetical protein